MRSENLARSYRLLIAIFAPPIFGAILFLIFAFVTETNSSLFNIGRTLEYLAQFHVVIFFAFVFVGIQSLAFSLIMEFLVRPKSLGLGYFLLISCILGLLAALVPGVLVDGLGLFLPIGFLIGIFVGLLIYDRGTEIGRRNG